jgi:hypothetical protein
VLFPCTVRAKKSRRMNCIGHVAHMGKINAYRILVENLKRRDSLEYVDVDGNIILKCILNTM